MSTELTADGKAMRSFNEAHEHPTYADYVWLDRARAAVAEERRKREAATNACRKLITEHTQRQQERDEARAELAAIQVPEGIRRIAAERQRQIERKGWTPEHDDEHKGRELVVAAAAYAFADTSKSVPFVRWPWEWSWWKPSDNPIRNLEKAGALIAAEIDRLIRLAPPAQPAAAPAATEHPVSPEIAQICETVRRLTDALPEILDAPPRDTSAWREPQVGQVFPATIRYMGKLKPRVIIPDSECTPPDGVDAALAKENAWRECVAAVAAGGTYDLVPEPEPAVLDPALREPLTLDGREWMSEYDPTPAREYVWLGKANARIAALGREIDRLQAELAATRRDALFTRWGSVLAKLANGTNAAKSDWQIIDEHIAGEPARQRAAVVAELRSVVKAIRKNVTELINTENSSRLAIIGGINDVAYEIEMRISKLEREGSAKEGGDV